MNSAAEVATIGSKSTRETSGEYLVKYDRRNQRKKDWTRVRDTRCILFKHMEMQQRVCLKYT